MLPLYSEAQPHGQELDRDTSANMGLWFDRFFNGYNHNFSEISKPTDLKEVKKQWIHTLDRHAGKEEQLESFAKNQCRLIHSLGGLCQEYRTEGRFITGMGNSHPIENGLSWHFTLGVPYLPGSAVKGLVRAWVEQWQDEIEESKKRQLLTWFGSEDKEPGPEQNQQAGEIIFYDAIPINPVKLHIDIMTPHMGKWYEKGGDITNVDDSPEAVPADWHDPVPIKFLSMDKGAEFLFSIAPRQPKSWSVDSLTEVIQVLNMALEWLGAGAKTALGYGQMVQTGKSSIEDKVKNEDEKEHTRKLSPEGLVLHGLKKELERTKKLNDARANTSLRQRTLDIASKAKSWPQVPERQELANLIVEVYEFIGWGKTKKKRKVHCIIKELRN